MARQRTAQFIGQTLIGFKSDDPITDFRQHMRINASIGADIQRRAAINQFVDEE